jgi:mRNA-degrading endonuclease toxin of MazEF toxin-antitoxin module
MEQTGRRPVVVWQSDALTSVLASVLVVPLTTNLDRAHLAGTAVLQATEGGLPEDSVALAFQMRAIPSRMRARTAHMRWRPIFVHLVPSLLSAARCVR